MAEPQVVKFDAELRQIKSMADGTFNLTLNLPEYALEQTQEMMGWLKHQVDVAVVCVPPLQNNTIKKDEKWEL